MTYRDVLCGKLDDLTEKELAELGKRVSDIERKLRRAERLWKNKKKGLINRCKR